MIRGEWPEMRLWKTMVFTLILEFPYPPKPTSIYLVVSTSGMVAPTHTREVQPVSATFLRSIRMGLIRSLVHLFLTGPHRLASKPNLVDGMLILTQRSALTA